MSGLKKELSIRRIIVTICIIILAWFLLSTINRYVNISKGNNETNTKGFFGYKPVIVITGSMVPAVQINSISIVEFCSIDDLNIGDIVLYKLYNGIMITHRVIEISEVGGVKTLTTKGDANESADSIPITSDMVQGKIIKTYNSAVPFVNMFMVEPGVINSVAVGQALTFIILFITALGIVIDKLIQMIRAVYWVLCKDEKYLKAIDDYEKMINTNIEIYNDLVDFESRKQKIKNTLWFKIKYGWAKAKVLRELGYIQDNSRDVLKAKNKFDNILK